MKIALITYGTRGDVQPVLSLAFALQARGHEPRLIGPINAASWAQAAGVPFTALPVDVHALLAKPAAQRMLARGDMRSFFKWLAYEELAYRDALREALLAGCSDADGLIGHALMEDRAAAIASARRIPLLPLYFFPVPPSREFPSPFISTRNLGPLNPLTHKLLLDMLWRASREDVALLRRQLNLAPATMSFTRLAQQQQLPCALAYSEALLPRPRDYGPHNTITGSITVPDALRSRLGEGGLPQALRVWLERGPPPVFLGFGSMPVLDVPRMLECARTALRRLGLRGVIGAGWSELPAGGDDTLIAVGNVDHTALFPRCAIAVHHGGAGTTYASLRAGVPTLICSVFADQPFWGVRCRALGVGETFPFARFSTERLERSLRKLLDPAVESRAKALALRLEAERSRARNRAGRARATARPARRLNDLVTVSAPAGPSMTRT